MDVSFCHDAVERRRDLQVALHLADRFERLTRGFDILLRRRDLTLIRLDRLLCEHHIVAGDHAGRRGRRFQLVVRARIGVRFRPDRAELRFRALELRLRFRPLRRQFGRLEHRDQLAGAQARAAIDADGLHESRHPGVDRDRLVRVQFARQRQRHVDGLLQDADDLNRRRSRRRGLLGWADPLPPHAASPIDRTTDPAARS